MIAMMWWAAAAVDARAEGARCEQPVEVRDELAASGITGLVVRGVDAPVRIVRGSGEIGAVATTCTADRIKLKLKRSGSVAIATLAAPADAGAGLVLSVPPEVVAVTVDHLNGPLQVENVAARVAVVSTTGPVAVDGAESLRVGYVSGPLTVAKLGGDLAVDAHTGDLNATDIGGNIVIDGIVGAVAVDRVQGGLTVRENVGSVAQSNVHGDILTE